MLRLLRAAIMATVLVFSISPCLSQEQRPLTNQDIIAMVNAGLSEDIVIAKIKVSRTNFDTSVEALKTMKAAGIPNPIILSMIEGGQTSTKATSTTTKTAQTSSEGGIPFRPTPTKNGRDWRNGRIRDTEKERITTYGGTTTTGTVDNNGNMSATSNRSSWNHKHFTFVVEGEDYIYVVSHTISFRWTKEAKVTVNAPVFYAVDRDKFYLLDEEGREFKLKIDKRILKESKP